jgi:DNA-binding NarL/FixJ family response regulator
MDAERSRKRTVLAHGGRPSSGYVAAGRGHERVRAERELAAHIAVADALAVWEDTDNGFASLLSGLADSLGYVVAVLWVPRGERLVPRAFWQAEGQHVDRFKAMTLTSRLPRGVELPGRVWERRAPATRASDGDDAPPRSRAARAAGLAGALAFPAIWDEQVLAVIELGSVEEPELNEQLSRSLGAIGTVVGHFLAHRRVVLDGQPITERQLQVLMLAAQGLTGPQIAARLGVSRTTVKTHFEHTYARLGVNSRAAAVAEAIRLGLVD